MLGLAKFSSTDDECLTHQRLLELSNSLNFRLYRFQHGENPFLLPNHPELHTLLAPRSHNLQSWDRTVFAWDPERP